MLHVGDLPKSMEYYEKCLGMKAIRTRDNPEHNYTLGFMGYGPEDESCVLELTYNYGVETYDMGNAYGQIAISTKDVYKTAEAIKQAGREMDKWVDISYHIMSYHTPCFLCPLQEAK